MPRFALHLTAPANVTAEEAASSFYWLADQRSSFTPGIGPSLGTFGAVPALNIDVVRIALAAFAADRSVPRSGGGSNWNQREIGLQVAVSDADRWQSVASDLTEVLGFLSGDRWDLTFVKEQAPTEAVPFETMTPAPTRVVLLSGGADSAIGGLYSRSLLQPDEGHVLLSHYSATILAPIQRHIVSELSRLIPGPSQHHVHVHLGRRGERLDGTKYPTEPTSRSRSFLFLSLGLSIASIYEIPLWIPENGFASLNPPLGPERLGSLSTRTTHPAFLQGLSSALKKAGAHADIENPFAEATKGEMYRRVVDLVGPAEASTFLSATHSCALVGQRAHGISPERSCGVCFGCILRRASFAASGVIDKTNYIAPNEDVAVQRWLDEKSVERPVRNFIRRGVQGRDLVAMGLPTTRSLREAMDLCQRGVAELRSLYP